MKSSYQTVATDSSSILPELNYELGSPKLSKDEMWQAIISRDFRFHGSFVYAVKSTKIFCRPTCASRKPSREEEVRFYPNSKAAMNDGYRACHRCKPDSENELPASVSGALKACSYIDENYDSKISLPMLARIAGQSMFHFHRNFRKVTGVTPRQYLEAVRLKHVKIALKRGESTRTSTYKAGHSSSSWLYSEGTSKLGMQQPSAYKSGGRGLTMSYAIADCSLGKVLVAGTQSGICFVCLGDSNDRLVAHLKDEYANAIISSDGGGADLQNWVAEIVEYLDGKTRLEQANLPLDVTATAFQLRVWKELQKIPYGRTRSYNEVAERIGNPKAYRAVANACGSNRVPLVIPCHRVVRKNGDMGGFRWGTERKKKLLAMEAQRSPV